MRPPEALLHHWWRWRLWRGPLETVDGRRVWVRSPGRPNADEGPDFVDADVEIDGIRWRGHVEIDVEPSGWKAHGHDRHPHYRAVVLHVVWEVAEPPSHGIPTVAARPHFRADLLERWHQLMEGRTTPACTPLLNEAVRPVMAHTIARHGIQRMQDQAERLFRWLDESGHHWESVAYWWMARYMGSGPNADAFEAVARHLPLTVLWKHRDQPTQVEALFFGMAGLVPEPPPDDYARRLRDEFQFLRRKYGLRPPVLQWKTARMRPANFPTVRLAQLAAYLHHHGDFLRPLLAVDSGTAMARFVAVPVSDYWQRHYSWGRPYRGKAPRLGRQWIHNLLINVAAPLQYAYGMHQANEWLQRRALELWDRLPAERHRIVRPYAAAGFPAHSALHTQGILHLARTRCASQGCLQCPVGRRILGGDAHPDA